MQHDSRASFLAHNFATLCFDCKPKARVVTFKVLLWFIVFKEKWEIAISFEV
jgi:hypothetical protein